MLVSNNTISLHTTQPQHFGIDGETVKPLDNDPTSNFAQVLNSFLDKVNNTEMNAQNMQQRMVENPESVNLHDVTIAQTEAELALSFTKSVSSRLITAFNELTNLR